MFCSPFDIVFFWGGSILSELGFRGKYSKIKHTRCIFLNIFVQDCIFKVLKSMCTDSKYCSKKKVFVSGNGIKIKIFRMQNWLLNSIWPALRVVNAAGEGEHTWLTLQWKHGVVFMVTELSRSLLFRGCYGVDTQLRYIGNITTLERLQEAFEAAIWYNCEFFELSP